MIVYKFGGASIKNAESIKNVISIIKECDYPLTVVVSAMGKTTNLLEQLIDSYFYGEKDKYDILLKFYDFHISIINELFENNTISALKELDLVSTQLEQIVSQTSSDDYDFEYSRIICFGELLSSTIISLYLNQIGVKSKRLDIRDYVKTKKNLTNAVIDWDVTREKFEENDFSNSLVITQGFIACDQSGSTATLGREGSDFSAAILAYLLEADKMIIWKDVLGVLNGDPDHFKETEMLHDISYKNAVELAYLGARVIHPKTIKPLEKAEIPLYVRSFVKKDLRGTKISNCNVNSVFPPNYIIKKNQVFISISPDEFSFVGEESVGDIFELVAKHRLKINFIDISGHNLSLCVDYNKRTFDSFITTLSKEYNADVQPDRELLTIYKYNDESIAKVMNEMSVITHQRTDLTARFVL